MADDSMRLILTKEQRAMIKRLSGQDMDAIDLMPDESDTTNGTGTMLKFQWRLSATSGIPRQKWTGDGDGNPSN